ncbi:Membrane-bound lytic murein transglycosylase C [Entomobacter blattae]|uniref:Membrane-bound lytic murein transglycosylase C n=2 Tax=Entomobacter blattae TaxID=2762277 RepID=A0A7H1NSG4_9PROT|nr:Membrane-bound lytic murein transglycosylase C [Entomobacter blattae]
MVAYKIIAAFFLASCASQTPTPSNNSISPSFYTGQTLPPSEPENTLQDSVKTYLSLLSTQGGSPSDYAYFLIQHPAWPNHQYMQTRLLKKLASEPEDAIASPLCLNQPIPFAPALVRCANIAPLFPIIAKKSHQIWQTSLLSTEEENKFYEVFKNYLSTEDHWKRFLLLVKEDHFLSAKHLLPLLLPEQKKLASAILAYQTNTPQADRFLLPLEPKQLSHPTLFLSRVRWLRKNNQIEEAVKLWKDQGNRAELYAASDLFWQERKKLVQTLLQRKHISNAILIADDGSCLPHKNCNDSAFLAGWMTLRLIHQPEKARKYFVSLTREPALSVKAEGYFWLGETFMEAHQPQDALSSWSKAAQYPTVFYGQIALFARNTGTQQTNFLTDPIPYIPILYKALSHHKEPLWTLKQATDFLGNELIQAATLLIAEKDYKHATAFIMQAGQNDPTPEVLSLAAAFAHGVNSASAAVMLSRKASQEGIALFPQGWPMLELSSPPLPTTDQLLTSLTLAIIRQESNFNPTISSSAGAVGLMQLMPATAKDMAEKNHIKITTPISISALTDATLNTTLGMLYLKMLLKTFNNALPYTIAAYNAGPTRVKTWLPTPPATSPIAMLDWIENMPYPETRHYIKQVWQNFTLYQALYHSPPPS